MRAEETRNVSLTAEMNSFIREQVASGRYQNASEVVRTALRLLQDREQGVERREPPVAETGAKHDR